MGEVLADPTTGLEGLDRRRRDGRRLGVEGEVAVHPLHQVGASLGDGPSWREARPCVVRDGRHERRAGGRVDVGRGVVGPEPGRLEALLPDHFPRRAVGGPARRRCVDVHAGRGLDDERPVGRIDHDGQGLLAEGAQPTKAAAWPGSDSDETVQDRLGARGPGGQTKDASREGDLGPVGVGRPVPEIVDHASALSLTVGTALAPFRK